MSWANKTAFFLICFAVVFTTMAYGTVHQPVIAVFYLLVTLPAMLWAIDGFYSGNLRVSRSYLQIPLLAAFVYAFVQIIPFGKIGELGGVENVPRTISLEPFATQLAAVHFLALAIFFSVLLVLTDSAARLRKLVLLITIFGFIYSFYAILQAILSPAKIYGIYESRYGSPFGSFVNRHNFAAYIEMTLSLPLGLLFVGAIGKDKRLLYLTAIGLMGVALLLSGSRGGLVAFLAEVIFLIILTTKSKNYGQIGLKIGLAGLLLAGVIVGAILVGGETSLTRFAETAASDNFTTNRSHIWSVTLDVIKHNLPLGAGFGAFGTAYPQFDSFNGFQRVEQAHNDYLQVLADAGIVGFIIGGLFLFWLFKTGLASVKTSNTYRRGIAVGALAGCFAILVHSLFDFVLHITAISLLFLTLLALVVSSGNAYADDVEELPNAGHKKRRTKSSVVSIEEGKKRKEIQS